MVVGGLVWYLNRSYGQQKNDSTLPEQIPSEANTISGTESVLYYVTIGSAREIWQINTKLEVKKVFTDADEREKIVKLSNIASQSLTVLAITASNKLASINLRDGKLTIIQNNFSLPDAISLSDSGGQILYTRFSNVDEDYGYTLYLEDKTGQNLSKLANSQSEIYSPIWIEDAKIIYSTIDGTTGEIFEVDKQSKNQNLLAKFENRVVDTLFYTSEKIFYSLSSIGATSGEVYSMNLDSSAKVKIFDFDGGMINFLSVSQDKLAYLIAQYNGKINDQTSGQIYLFDLSQQKKQSLKKGSQILGWWP